MTGLKKGNRRSGKRRTLFQYRASGKENETVLLSGPFLTDGLERLGKVLHSKMTRPEQAF